MDAILYPDGRLRALEVQRNYKRWRDDSFAWSPRDKAAAMGHHGDMLRMLGLLPAPRAFDDARRLADTVWRDPSTCHRRAAVAFGRGLRELRSRGDWAPLEHDLELPPDGADVRELFWRYERQFECTKM